MGMIIATRTRNQWKQLRDGVSFHGGVADEVVVRRGTFDSKTGRDGKLPRARAGVPSVDDARLAVRAIMERDWELVVDSVFVSTRTRGGVSYVDVAGVRRARRDCLRAWRVPTD